MSEKPKTIYELVTLVKLDGFAEFADPVRRYDELQSDLAHRDYEDEAARAKTSIGNDRTVYTNAGRKISGTVVGAAVELWSYRTNGEGWQSERRIVGSDEARKFEGSRTVVGFGG